MLQKVVCDYTTPVSKFKANPATVLADAPGEAIAVSSHNEILFYAVPAKLYEELVAFIEKHRNSPSARLKLTAERVAEMTAQIDQTNEKEL